MHLADRLELPGRYRARPYAGPTDHAAMARTLTEFRRAKGNPELVTAEHLDRSYAYLADCDPELDIAIVELDGELVGYARPSHEELENGHHDLVVFAPVHPDHQSEDLVGVLIDQQEVHLRRWLPGAGRPRFRAYAGHPGPELPATGEAARLEERGYVATEWGASLRRPHLDDIPELALPDGVEVRPVRPEQMRTILDAHFEAFRGEWDFHEPTEADLAEIIDEPHRDETLWQVAWHRDQVVGQVKPFINRTENDERGYRRGYTEHISTHHEWRNRGIAGALLARSLRAIRDRGMTEAVLGVDTNNPGGAFQLYTKLGFVVESYEAVYTKPVQTVTA